MVSIYTTVWSLPDSETTQYFKMIHYRFFEPVRGLKEAT